MLQRYQWPDRDIEIGFVLKRSTWGAGYATEACARLVEFAFLESSMDTIHND
ncbi:GNAT family N-acetyltransferase [Ruegeria sp. AU67]|uniref:GNAT family N-acetyltransferase n=1 Tax=Ruegeria sp. AU67 TaxID=2108530 RepID=UPI00135CAAD1